MKYYTRDGQNIDIDTNKLQFINSGSCADIYKKDDIIFKKYKKFKKHYNSGKIIESIFDFLKTIDSQNLIKLYELYTDKLFNINDLFEIEAYTAMYYKEEYINILTEQKDYLLENINRISILLHILANNRILATDIKKENTILTSNNIILIDPDLYSKTKYPLEKINLEHNIKLRDLIMDFIISTIISNTPNNFDLSGVYKTINKLFDFEIKENTDIAYELSKKLTSVKNQLNILIKNYNY